MKDQLRRWWIPGLFVGMLFVALPGISYGQATTLDSVLVVPNPYTVYGRTFGPSSTLQDFEKVEFRNVPVPITLRIYTSAGNLVHTKQISRIQELNWNGRNLDNMYVASDVYIYVFDHATLGRTVGKFVVLR